MSVERRTLEVDPAAQSREDYHYDHADDRIILSTSQDVAPIIEEAKRIRNASVGWGKNDFTSVAKLSMVHCIELMKLGIMSRGFAITDEAAFDIWLSNHSDFKTTPGRF